MAHASLFLGRRGALSALTVVTLLSACTIRTTTYETTPKSEPQPSAEPAKPEPAAEKPKPKPEPEKPKPKPAAKPEKPKPPVAKPEPQPEPKPEPKPEAKPEPKPEAKPEPKPEPKPVPAAPKPQPETSNIVVPVKVSLAALSEQIDALVPKQETRDWKRVTDGNDSPRAEVKADIWRAEPVKVTFSDETFHITVPVRYAANIRAWVKNPLKPSKWISIAKDESWGTKQEPQRLTATFHAKVGVDEQWKISSELRLGEIEHGPAPSGKICKNVGIDICVERETIASRVNRGIDDYLRPRIEKALAKLDGRIEKSFNLQKRAAAVWSELQKPQAVNVPNAKEPLWIVTTPSSVGLAGPTLDGADVRIDLAIAGRIAVVGGKKPSVKPAPLPKLSDVKQPAGFHVITELNVPYAAMDAALVRQLKDMKIGKTKVVSVVSAKLVAKPDPKQPRRITLEIGLGGAVQDTLVLTGELAYDARKGRLGIEKLAAVAQPGSELEKKLQAAEIDAIRKQIERKVSWNLADEAAPLEKGIAAALSERLRGQVQVSGALRELDVREFELGAEGLVARVIVGGELQVSYVQR